MAEESVNIVIPYGGLGDSLFYSPLPRLLKQSGVSKVNVHCLEAFRSVDIMNIVWGMNPYVDSVNDRAHLSERKIPQNICNNSKLNLLAKTAIPYGIYVSDELKPELYYSPRKIGDLAGKILVDLNYVSFVGVFSKKAVLEFLKNKKELVFVNRPEWVPDTLGENFQPDNLKQYADMISSSESFICFTSGGATLADALGVQAICLYGFGQKRIFHHSSMHKYVDCSSKSLLFSLLGFVLHKLRKLFGG